MCRYCDDEKNNRGFYLRKKSLLEATTNDVNLGTIGMSIDIIDGKLCGAIEAEGDPVYFTDSVKIRFCPMCGRKFADG